ncbi:monothiol glutaredoxin grx4 [Tulasnella sp. 419]|nr:monothiol glutaredoxin grx4 [Tulasnella sp. 419]
MSWCHRLKPSLRPRSRSHLKSKRYPLSSFYGQVTLGIVVARVNLSDPLLKGHTLLDRISGADASALTKAVARHSTKVPQALSKTTQEPAKPLTADQLPAEEKKESVVPEKKEETEEELNARMRGLMNQSKIVVFMKGTPDAPRCGFSRKTVATLREQGVAFTHFDILSDEAVRQGMKKLNDWPTFPQIIVNGELFGGLDILNESILTGEFDQVKADLKA